jgi:hypothetical protein
VSAAEGRSVAAAPPLVVGRGAAGLRTRGGQPLIFMVGCGHVDECRFVFRCFTADALTEAAEADVIER